MRIREKLADVWRFLNPPPVRVAVRPGWTRISISKAKRDPIFAQVWARRIETNEADPQYGIRDLKVDYEGLKAPDVEIAEFHSSNNVREYFCDYRLVTPDGGYEIVDRVLVMLDLHIGSEGIRGHHTEVFKRLADG